MRLRKIHAYSTWNGAQKIIYPPVVGRTHGHQLLAIHQLLGLQASPDLAKCRAPNSK